MTYTKSNQSLQWATV